MSTPKKNPPAKRSGNNGRKSGGRESASKSGGNRAHSPRRSATKRGGARTAGKNPTKSNTRNGPGGSRGRDKRGRAKGANAATTSVSNYRHSSHDRANLPTEQTSRYMGDHDRRPVKYRPPLRSLLGPALSWDRDLEACEGETLASPLYIREKIHPSAIAESLQKSGSVQLDLFGNYDGLPKDAAYEWYRHKGNWQNRLINGESRHVMSSLLAKESMAGKVQMVYFDPPYGISFRSNMQADARNRDVDDKPKNRPNDPVHLRVFRDTYENGIHSYLDNIYRIATHARALLADSGSFFMQIGGANVHRAAVVLDEVFGAENRIATITFSKGGSRSSKTLPKAADYILWYANDIEKVKYRRLYEQLETRKDVLKHMSSYAMVQLESGENRTLSPAERDDPDRHLPPGSRLYVRQKLESDGWSSTGRSEPYHLKSKGKVFKCRPNTHWSISHDGLDRLEELGRLDGDGKSLHMKRYEDEIPGKTVGNLWHTQMSPSDLHYVVETDESVVERCMLMATDPGDLVYDPTCGSGTTAYVAERWGRRWITSDSSLVAVTLTRQRLLTGIFDYYILKDSLDGSRKERELDAESNPGQKQPADHNAASYGEDPAKGFVYRRVRTVSAATLAYDRGPTDTPLVNLPFTKKSVVRVSSPFTVESHSPYRYIDPREAAFAHNADETKDYYRTIIHALETSGIKSSKSSSTLRVDDVVPYVARKSSLITHMSVVGGKNAALMIAPDDCTVPPELIDRAAEEAARMGRVDALIVIAFAFEAEVRSGELEERGRLEIRKVQANSDLLVGNLKDTESDRAFVLIGEPDITVRSDPDNHDQIIVRVDGYDTYDPKTRQIGRGTADEIICWMIDTDYDGRSFYARRVFFPGCGGDGQIKAFRKGLERNLDPDLWDALLSCESAPFPKPKDGRIAVRIITATHTEMTTVIDTL